MYKILPIIKAQKLLIMYFLIVFISLSVEIALYKTVVDKNYVT